MIIAAPPLLGWRDAAPVPKDECNITQNKGYTIYSTVGAFYLPLVVMVVMYARVFRATAKRTKHWVTIPGTTARKEKKRKKKLTEVSVLISAPDEVRKYDEDSTPKHYDNRPEDDNDRQTGHLGYKLNTFTDNRSSIESLNEIEIEYNESVNADSRLSTSPDHTPAHQSLNGIKQRQLIARVSSNATTDTNMSFEFSDSDVKLSGCYKTVCKDKQSSSSTLVNQKEKKRSELGVHSGSTASLGDKLIRADSQKYGSPKMKRSSCVVYQPDEMESSRRKVSSCVVYLDGNLSPSKYNNHSENSGHHISSRKSSCMIFREEPPLKEEDLKHLSESKRKKYARKNRRQKWKISLSQEKRAAKTLGIIVGCFILCWLPFFMIALIQPLCSTCTVHPILTGIITWLGYLNSALNPIIYTFFNRDFRIAFKRILFCGSCKR